MTLPSSPTLRKNIVPLLGIAFVVAVLCTGLFYGVFASRFGVTHAASLPEHAVVVATHDLTRGSAIGPADVKLGQLLTDAPPKGLVANADELAGKTLIVAAPEGTPILECMLSSGADDREIPAGMRAMTLRPADSSSVLGVLQPARRVDIQAWSDRGGEPQLRTILQNVEVLAVPRNGDGAITAITVLVPAAKADDVALADSAAHIRIALRSSTDTTSNGPGRTAMAALFSGQVQTPRPTRGRATLPEIAVSILGVTDAGIQKLARISGASPEHGLRVHDLDPNGSWERTVKETLASREAVEVSAAHAGAAYGNTVQFGNHTWRVRLRFRAADDNRVRIEPEVITRAGDAITVRRTHGHGQPALQSGAAAMVTGLCGSEEDRASLVKAAARAGVNVRDVIILVRSHAPALSASLPRTVR